MMCKKNEYSYLWLNGKLIPIDRCIAPLILQLNMAGIKTLDSCCGHGKSYPVVICEAGTKEALQKFGCKIAIPRERDGKVMAYFPVNSFNGKVYKGEYKYMNIEREKEIKKIKDRFNKSTKGTWRIATYPCPHVKTEWIDEKGRRCSKLILERAKLEDAEFIANSKRDIEYLLNIIEND